MEQVRASESGLSWGPGSVRNHGLCVFGPQFPHRTVGADGRRVCHCGPRHSAAPAQGSCAFLLIFAKEPLGQAFTTLLNSLVLLSVTSELHAASSNFSSFLSFLPFTYTLATPPLSPSPAFPCPSLPFLFPVLGIELRVFALSYILHLAFFWS